MKLFDYSDVDGEMAVSRPIRTVGGLCRPFLLLALIVPLLGGEGREAAAETKPPALDLKVGFNADILVSQARELSERTHVAPTLKYQSAASELASTYDEFRKARFRADAAIQLDSLGEYQLHLLPVAWIHREEVEVSIVSEGIAEAVTADPSMFDMDPLKKVAAFAVKVPLSGFRITGPLNSSEKNDEIIVFQGASYFRALSRGQNYGISARGLALGTGGTEGEEFPRFTKFWIERPEPNSGLIVIHALLESESLTGAYKFEVRPGAPTDVDVEATIFPRVEITEVGIAPLTSMYLLSSSDRTRVSDFRPAVHDSDGLSVHNGLGEHLWRPLANPHRIETSTFLDKKPGGFGLEQRERQFAAYQDMEALYHLRPSVWVEPKGDWGKGSVMLVELPTEVETNDNIVAFWRPAEPLEAGRAHTFSYRLSWPDTFRHIGPKARVVRTMAGLSIGNDRHSGAVQFVLEYSGSGTIADEDAAPLPVLKASHGRLSKAQVQLNRVSGTLRVAFKFYPGASETSELRVAMPGIKGGAEIWLYRWTKGMHQ